MITLAIPDVLRFKTIKTLMNRAMINRIVAELTYIPNNSLLTFVSLIKKIRAARIMLDTIDEKKMLRANLSGYKNVVLLYILCTCMTNVQAGTNTIKIHTYSSISSNRVKFNVIQYAKKNDKTKIIKSIKSCKRLAFADKFDLCIQYLPQLSISFKITVVPIYYIIIFYSTAFDIKFGKIFSNYVGIH
jgi:hypothetical protein